MPSDVRFAGRPIDVQMNPRLRNLLAGFSAANQLVPGGIVPRPITEINNLVDSFNQADAEASQRIRQGLSDVGERASQRLAPITTPLSNVRRAVQAAQTVPLALQTGTGAMFSPTPAAAPVGRLAIGEAVSDYPEDVGGGPTTYSPLSVSPQQRGPSAQVLDVQDRGPASQFTNPRVTVDQGGQRQVTDYMMQPGGGYQGTQQAATPFATETPMGRQGFQGGTWTPGTSYTSIPNMSQRDILNQYAGNWTNQQLVDMGDSGFGVINPTRDLAMGIQGRMAEADKQLEAARIQANAHTEAARIQSNRQLSPADMIGLRQQVRAKYRAVNPNMTEQQIEGLVERDPDIVAARSGATPTAGGGAGGQSTPIPGDIVSDMASTQAPSIGEMFNRYGNRITPQNWPQVEQFLRDRFGSAAFDQAAQGSILETLRNPLFVWPGGTPTDEQSGLAALRNLMIQMGRRQYGHVPGASPLGPF